MLAEGIALSTLNFDELISTWMSFFRTFAVSVSDDVPEIVSCPKPVAYTYPRVVADERFRFIVAPYSSSAT